MAGCSCSLTKTRVSGELDPSFEQPHDVEIVGMEVNGAPAGSSVEIPADADAYPTPLRALAPGRYIARAELDVQHRYTYDGGRPGDPDSGNLRVTIAPGARVAIAVQPPVRPTSAPSGGARAGPARGWKRSSARR